MPTIKLPGLKQGKKIDLNDHTQRFLQCFRKLLQFCSAYTRQIILHSSDLASSQSTRFRPQYRVLEKIYFIINSITEAISMALLRYLVLRCMFSL